MPPLEVIDLCLSEDEYRVPLSTTAPTRADSTWAFDFDLSEDDYESRPKRPSKKRKMTSSVLPIEDEFSGIVRAQKRILLYSDDGDFDSSLQLPEDSTSRLNLSTRTASLLAEISQNSAGSRKPLVKKPGATKKNKTGRPTREDDLSETSQPARKARLTSTEREVKRLDKEREKLQRAEVKEEEKRKRQSEAEARKERRKLEKEQKAREKQVAADLAEVNRARWNKDVSTPEMIVDLPASISGKSVDTQVREIFKRLGVETTSYSSLLPDVIKWRRKVSAVFNEEMSHWERAPTRVQDERHALCLVNGQSFAAMACSKEEDESLDKHVAEIKKKFPDYSVIYVIEGLETLLKRGKNTKNRSYQNAVRQQSGSEESREFGGRNSVPPGINVDEDAVEDALLQLQALHGCIVHHTCTPTESAEWIVSFTQHISTIPYKYVGSPLLALI